MPSEQPLPFCNAFVSISSVECLIYLVVVNVEHFSEVDVFVLIPASCEFLASQCWITYCWHSLMALQEGIYAI